MAQSAQRQSGYAQHPGYRVDLHPCAKRVRVSLGGRTIADSTRTLLVRETGLTPVYYFPRADVDQSCLEATGHSTFCPFKGEAAYWSVRAGGKLAENAIWSYPEPFPEVEGLKDTLAFYWNRMDAWHEEEEEVFVHARDPFVRVDVLESSRSVAVMVDGEEVARSTRPRLLFETGLPVRYYLPREDVRMELLESSDTKSDCPYKGTASYYSLQTGKASHEDLVWFYPNPLPEVAKIKDLLCFFDENVEAVLVDGERQTIPQTKWSAATG